MSTTIKDMIEVKRLYLLKLMKVHVDIIWEFMSKIYKYFIAKESAMSAMYTMTYCCLLTASQQNN